MATETGVTRPVGRRSWSWSAVLFPVLALLQGGSVFAQTAPTSEPQALEEVVITAEKRVSTVQQTPLSISAVSGDELAALGRVSVADIAEIVPGISMRNSGPGQTEFVMRGLASSAGSGPTVGFYLDEVPLPPAAGSLNGKVVVDPSLYDLSRVEVLRGPQGTLYGSGSMGGTIKLVTTPPQLNVFEGSAHADGSETAGGGINRGGDLALNIPLVQDHVAARIVGTSQYTDGWIDRDVLDNFPTGPGGNCGYYVCTRGNVLAEPISKQYTHTNWSHLEALRADLLWKVGDNTTIRPFAMYQTIYSGGPGEYDSPPGTLAHYQPVDQAEPFSDRFDLFAVTLTHEFQGAQLTANGAYFNRRQSLVGDTSEEQQSLLGEFYGLTDYSAAPYSEIDRTTQRSVEVRLTSSGDGRFQWIGGLFASNFESIYDAYVANPAWASASTGGAAANPTGIAYQVDTPYHMKQYAVFGESSYKITDALKATVGLRWYKYDTTMHFEQAGFFTPSGSATPYAGDVSGSWSGVNPKFNLAYVPGPNLTTYASISKGFRPGGVNTPISQSVCGQSPPLSYDPDTIWNYEVGEKTRFLEGQLSLNADLYYIQWKGLQQSLTIPACGLLYTGNVGDAHSYGPELELSWHLTRSLVASFSGAYTESEVTHVAASSQGNLLAANQPLTDGVPIQNVPKYTLSTWIEYQRQLANGYQASLRVLDAYVASQHDLAFYFQELPGYNLLNMRLGLARGAWQAHLFGDNLLNKQAELTINTTSYSLLVPAFNRVATNQPRTFGLDLQYQF